MPKRTLPYLSKDVSRHGQVRWYVRKPGRPKIRISETYGTDAFFAAYRDALASKAPPKKKEQRSKAPGAETLHGLCVRYFSAAEFKGLDDGTRKRRRTTLEKLCQMTTRDGQSYGSLPYRDLLPRHVRAIRDRNAEKPGAANFMLKALRQVFTMAVANDLADRNPARDVPYLKPAKAGGFPAWTDDDVRKFESAHPIGTRARLAITMLIELGQRISDIHRLGPKDMADGWLVFTQFKNRNRSPVEMSLKLSSALRQVLNATPHGETTFLLTDRGQPFASTKSFGNMFSKWCAKAGLKGKSAHGLRKYCAARLAEAGASDREIMSVTGHRTSKEVDRYTRSARATSDQIGS